MSTPTDRTQASLELLYNISRELASTLDLHTVLARVIALSIEYVKAESGSLVVLDENQHLFDAAFSYNGVIYSHTVDTMRDTMEQGLAGWVARNRQPALVTDTLHDERWLRRAFAQSSKSAICVPILLRDKLVGVLTIVHTTPGFFTLEHQALLQSIADQAGIAVNNAHLYNSLQAAHQRYHELFEDSIDPILITDWAGTIVEANRQACEKCQAQEEDLLTTSIFNLHSANSDKLGPDLKNLRDGETINYEAQFQPANRQPIPVEIHVRQVNFRGEQYIQWILRDISERKALDALRNDLSAMIYHDLRAPLSNIVSSLDMLSSMMPPDESLRSIIGIAQRSSDRLQRLINSLLDINRLEAGQPITNRKVVDIEALIKDSMDIISTTLQAKHQTLTTDIRGPLPPASIDSDMIRRVLINLLENGSKFTPLNGQITIGAELKGKEIQIWIQDTGPGIPAEAREHIFDKFTRIINTARPVKGLGLGLAFCRLAVQAHGGKIWVDPELTEGSRFIFTLPIVESNIL